MTTMAEREGKNTRTGIGFTTMDTIEKGINIEKSIRIKNKKNKDRR